MKKAFILMCLSLLAGGFVSCGDDDAEPDSGGGGKNDKAKLVVTGGLVSAELGYSEQNDWNTSVTDYYTNRYTVELSGYANLPSEMRVLLGLGLDLGVEVADNANFNNSRRVYVTSIDSENKFTVTTWSKAGEKLFWRSFLLAGDVKQYDDTRSASIPTIQQGFQKMRVELGETSNITERSATIGFSAGGGLWEGAQCAGIVYTTDKSQLTSETIKSQLDAAKRNDDWEDGMSSEQHYRYGERYIANNGLTFERSVQGRSNNSLLLWDLSSGTTYYYCEYRYAKDGSNSYIALSDVGEFATGGINIAEIRNNMDISITANDDKRQWHVSYSSSLERKYPNKTFRYGIVTYYPVDEGSYAVLINQTRMETESSFRGTIPYPTIIGIAPATEEGYAAGEVLTNLYNRIASGEADESDKAKYLAILRLIGIDEVANPDVSYVIEVHVVVDGNEYVVANERAFKK